MQRDFLVFVWWYGLLAVFVPCRVRLYPWAKAKVKSWSRAIASSLFACCSLVTDRFSLLDARKCAGCAELSCVLSGHVAENIVYLVLKT